MNLSVNYIFSLICLEGGGGGVVKPIISFIAEKLKECNEDEHSRLINCVNVVSPAGMIPVSIKRGMVYFFYGGSGDKGA